MQEILDDPSLNGLKPDNTAIKVLIADDAMFFRRAIRRFLEGAGYEVIGEAANGEEVIKLYQELKPDVVTMDITMPVIDGIEATGRIVAEHPGAKIVMISSTGKKNMLKDAIRQGARNFVEKPITRGNVKGFLTIVKKVFNQK